MRAFIGVGSNIFPEENILSALRMLKHKYHVTETSVFYATSPLGNRQQPEFINGVWSLWLKSNSTIDIFKDLKAIEQELGRVRTQDKYASRTIDLDLIYVEGVLDPSLKIPDPDIYERCFLALPLWELDSTLIMNDTGESVYTIIQRHNWTVENTGMRPQMALTSQLKKIINNSPA